MLIQLQCGESKFNLDELCDYWTSGKSGKASYFSNSLILSKIFFVFQPSTAGDVSNSESDESESAARNEPLQPEPVERWRSFSEGEQVLCVLKP